MRTWWRKFRRILSAVWVEVRREDTGESTAGRPEIVSGARTEIVGRVSGSNRTLLTERRREADIVRNRDTRAGRSFVAVEARSDREGLVARGREYELTLVAIKNAVHELEARGIRADGIILEPDEFKMMLRQNFQWEDGDPLPTNVTLFGLPVKVQGGTQHD